MTHVVIIDSDPVHARTAALALTTIYDARVEIIPIDEALKPGRGFDGAHLVLWNHQQGQPGTEELPRKLNAMKSKPQLIVLADGLEVGLAGTGASVLSKPFELADLLLTIDELLYPKLSPSPESGYLRVPLRTVLALGLDTCDLFVRLAETKFVRVHQSGSPVDPKSLALFANNKVEDLYIENEDAEALIRAASRRLGEAQGFAKLAESHHMIHEFSRAFGFTPELRRQMESSVDQALTAIERSPPLASVFEKVRVAPERYVSTHSIALAYVCGGIASLMGWATPVTCYKLTLASFLHDITLEDQELARLQTLRELDAHRPALSAAKTEQVLHHPEHAAALARRINGMPPDLDIILLQHHERPDGTGFPFHRGFASIHGLSSLFIVSHDLLSYREEHAGEDDAFENYLSRAEKLEWNGTFKRILQTLRETSAAP